jgi:hypothetical protein
LEENVNPITITNTSKRTINITPTNGGWINIDHSTTGGTVKINAYKKGGSDKTGL